MSKKYLLFVIIIFLCFTMIGCKPEKEITLGNIEKNLLKDIEYIYISKDWDSDLKELSEKEVQTLKKAIVNGTELTSIDGDLPSPKIRGNSVVLIVLNNKRYINVLYEGRSNYLYVTQEDVHWREAITNKSNLNWVKTHLTGIYRFHPGPEFKDLLTI